MRRPLLLVALVPCGGAAASAFAGLLVFVAVACGRSASGSTGAAGAGGDADAAVRDTGAPDVSLDTDAASRDTSPPDAKAEGDAAGVTDGSDGAPADADGATCPGGMKRCSGLCVVIDDPAYGCGASSCTPCALDHAVAACANGACVVGSCRSGFGDCDGAPANGCETPLNTDTNCGQCGGICPEPIPFPSPNCPLCSGGACVPWDCGPGSANCDCNFANGCETNVATDPDNCGICGTHCATGQVCTGGQCVNGPG